MYFVWIKIDRALVTNPKTFLFSWKYEYMVVIYCYIILRKLSSISSVNILPIILVPFLYLYFPKDLPRPSIEYDERIPITNTCLYDKEWFVFVEIKLFLYLDNKVTLSWSISTFFDEDTQYYHVFIFNVFFRLFLRNTTLYFTIYLTNVKKIIALVDDNFFMVTPSDRVTVIIFIFCPICITSSK